jgi:hypothetical protein
MTRRGVENSFLATSRKGAPWFSPRCRSLLTFAASSDQAPADSRVVPAAVTCWIAGVTLSSPSASDTV